jgi:hypothetical protein
VLEAEEKGVTSLFVVLKMSGMIDPMITATSAASKIFLPVAVGLEDSAAVAGDCGLPQRGQLGALDEISLPQSGHFTRGMARPSHIYTVLRSPESCIDA